MVRRARRVRLGLASILAGAAVQLGGARAPVEEPADSDRAALIERFLAPDAQPLVSYRAFRHMTALVAALDAEQKAVASPTRGSWR